MAKSGKRTGWQRWLTGLVVLGLFPTPRPMAATCADVDYNGSNPIIICDSDDDGFYEWPTGNTTTPGGIHIHVPVVMHGNVRITAQQIIIAQPVVTFPGAPLTNLRLTSKLYGMNLDGLDVTSTGNIVVKSRDSVVAGIHPPEQDLPVHLVAGKNIDIQVRNYPGSDRRPDLRLDGTLDPMTLSAGTKVTLRTQGRFAKSGGVHLVDTTVKSRQIVVSQPAKLGDDADALFLQGSLLTTNPARTGLPGPAGDIVLIASRTYLAPIARETAHLLDHSELDSGRNIVLKGDAVSEFCFDGGAVTANGGAGSIDLRKAIGVTKQVNGPAWQGAVLGSVPTIAPDC